MSSSRRWLVIFSAAIGILVLVTVALVLINRGGEVPLQPENTPQGTVQRYLLAIKDKDYRTAYNYLSDVQSGKPLTYDDWVRSVPFNPASNQTVWKASLGKTTVTSQEATVEIFVDVFRPGGPFEDPLRTQNIVFQLSKVDGKWLITSPNYIYWIY